MNKFYIAEEPYDKEKYYIAVKIVIYRQLHGKYPKFLKHYETDTRDGFTTKFAYLLDTYVMLDKEAAENKCAELEEKFAHILRDCENSGDWSNCPFNFEKMDILWSK